MSENNQAPIIIVRKKVSHGGHHGGAWKVAYADFVTAMMALFIVLWLMNSSEKIKKAISAYFQDPSGSGKLAGSASAGTGETVSVAKNEMEKLKEKLEQAFKKSPEFEKLKEYIKMSVTGEGLRVEMLESESGMFFQLGSPVPSPQGHDLIVRLAAELYKLPNELLIEGHTDSRPMGKRADYTNWELSTDRANAARRVMEDSGIPSERFMQVRGFADRHPRNKEDPQAAANRRVSVIVRYVNADSEGAQEEEEPEGGEKKAEAGEKKSEASQKPEAAKHEEPKHEEPKHEVAKH